MSARATAGDLSTRIWAGAPGLAEARRALAELKAARQRLTAAAGDTSEQRVRALGLQLADDLAGGGELPGDLLERVAAAAAAPAARSWLAYVFEVAEGQARLAVDRALADHTPAACRLLEEVLADVVEQARAAHRALGQARTLEEAHRAGRVDAWDRLLAAAGRFREVRREHRAIVRRAVDDVTEVERLLAYAGLFRNIADIDAGRRFIDGHGLARDWPNPDAETADFLRWSLENGAQLWVPTPDQLREADAALEQARREASDAKAARERVIEVKRDQHARAARAAGRRRQEAEARAPRGDEW